MNYSASNNLKKQHGIRGIFKSSKHIFIYVQKQPPWGTPWKKLFPNFKYVEGVVQNCLVCLRPCNFIKIETVAQVFSCEFCEIFKNTFFYRTPPVANFEYEQYLIMLPKSSKNTCAGTQFQQICRPKAYNFTE